MAGAPLALRVETDGACDAVVWLTKAHAALLKRHRPDLRDLRARIEAVAFQTEFEVEIRDLGDGEFIACAPRVITDLLIEARRLGVLEP